MKSFWFRSNNKIGTDLVQLMEKRNRKEFNEARIPRSFFLTKFKNLHHYLSLLKTKTHGKYSSLNITYKNYMIKNSPKTTDLKTNLIWLAKFCLNDVSEFVLIDKLS
jgi:hypothetical protein